MREVQCLTVLSIYIYEAFTFTQNEAEAIHIIGKGYTKQLYVHAMNNIPGHGHAHAEQTTDVLRIPITYTVHIASIYVNVRFPHAWYTTLLRRTYFVLYTYACRRRFEMFISF